MAIATDDDLAGLLADRLAAADDPDWYCALLASALDETRDLHAAMELADRAAEANEEGGLTELATDAGEGSQLADDDDPDPGDVDDGDGETLAKLYADNWNLLADAGRPPSRREIDQAGAELSGSGWGLTKTQHGWKPVPVSHGSDVVRMSTEHAPPGGVNLKGRFYKGGVFIPSAVIASLPKEDQQRLAHAKEKAKAGLKARTAHKVAGLADRLAQHKDTPLSDRERTAAKQSFAQLHRHHGDLVLHRVTEMADQLEAALKNVPADEEGLRGQLQRRLAALHGMVGEAEAKGVKVPIGKPAAGPVTKAAIGERLDTLLNKGGELDKAAEAVKRAEQSAEFHLHIHELANGKFGLFDNPGTGKSKEEHLVGQFDSKEEAEHGWRDRFNTHVKPHKDKLESLRVEMEKLRQLEVEPEAPAKDSRDTSAFQSDLTRRMKDVARAEPRRKTPAQAAEELAKSNHGANAQKVLDSFKDKPEVVKPAGEELPPELADMLAKHPGFKVVSPAGSTPPAKPAPEAQKPDPTLRVKEIDARLAQLRTQARTEYAADEERELVAERQQITSPATTKEPKNAAVQGKEPEGDFREHSQGSPGRQAEGAGGRHQPEPGAEGRGQNPQEEVAPAGVPTAAERAAMTERARARRAAAAAPPTQAKPERAGEAQVPTPAAGVAPEPPTAAERAALTERARARQAGQPPPTPPPVEPAGSSEAPPDLKPRLGKPGGGDQSHEELVPPEKERADREALVQRFERQHAADLAELNRAFPHGRPAAYPKGYDDRKRMVDDTEAALKMARERLGSLPAAKPAAVPTPVQSEPSSGEISDYLDPSKYATKQQYADAEYSRLKKILPEDDDETLKAQADMWAGDRWTPPPEKGKFDVGQTVKAGDQTGSYRGQFTHEDGKKYAVIATGRGQFSVPAEQVEHAGFALPDVDTRESHQKTWDERRKELLQGYQSGGRTKATPGELRDMRKKHEDAIRSALYNGKAVPPEVLADYPDLAPAAPPAPPDHHARASAHADAGEHLPPLLAKAFPQHAARATERAAATQGKVDRLSALKAAAEAPGGNHGHIAAELAGIVGTLDQAQAISVAKKLGIARTVRTKQDAVDAIRRKVFERKLAEDAIQY